MSVLFHCAIVTTDIGAEFGDDRPLDEARVRTLTVNRVHLLDLIDSNVTFVCELASPTVGCITRHQKHHLLNSVHSRDRSDKLLAFLTRRSVASFNQFTNVLSRYQPHLVPMLITDGGELLYMRVKNFQASVTVNCCILASVSIADAMHISYLSHLCQYAACQMLRLAFVLRICG